MKLNEQIGDPWRCVCPECGCYRIDKITGNKRSHKESYSANGNGKMKAKQSRAKKWLCYRCGKRLNHVIDRKQEKRVAIESVVG